VYFVFMESSSSESSAASVEVLDSLVAMFDKVESLICAIWKRNAIPIASVTMAWKIRIIFAHLMFGLRVFSL